MISSFLRTRWPLRALCAPFALLLLPACLDLKPAPAPVVRWVTVAEVPQRPEVSLAAPVTPELRLDRVTSSDAIGESLMRRQSDFELQFDDQVRWVEPPVDMVRRSLENELFRRRGFVRTSAGANYLHVELTAFEETFVPRHEAVVSFVVQYFHRDGSGVILEKTIDGHAAITDADPALVAQAMSAALHSAATELSDLLSVQ